MHFKTGSVDRVQIPMNKLSGLRHPRYAVILLTLADDELDTIYIPHERFKNRVYTGFDHLRDTPFTAMSEKLGAEGVVKVMNDVFQIIEDEVLPRHGEILKFIGDALLVIFPRCTDVSDDQVSENMIQSALQSVLKVEALGRQLGIPLSVGFGCHLGTVLYGNIGTESRLDFTVMGPAVNLTSRLESMCKSLGAQLTVSREVAQSYSEHLQSFGLHSVKGVAEPVEIWGVPVNS